MSNSELSKWFRAGSEQRPAFKTFSSMIKAGSQPIHHPENSIQVWVSCSKYGRQISTAHKETKAFHSSFCFSKSLNAATLAVSCCSMNNTSGLQCTRRSQHRGLPNERQMKAKRRSNNSLTKDVAFCYQYHIQLKILTLRRQERICILHFQIVLKSCIWPQLMLSL